jgi:hypothetical protein
MPVQEGQLEQNDMVVNIDVITILVKCGAVQFPRKSPCRSLALSMNRMPKKKIL